MKAYAIGWSPATKYTVYGSDGSRSEHASIEEARASLPPGLSPSNVGDGAHPHFVEMWADDEALGRNRRSVSVGFKLPEPPIRGTNRRQRRAARARTRSASK